MAGRQPKTLDMYEMDGGSRAHMGGITQAQQESQGIIRLGRKVVQDGHKYLSGSGGAQVLILTLCTGKSEMPGSSRLGEGTRWLPSTDSEGGLTPVCPGGVETVPMADRSGRGLLCS